MQPTRAPIRVRGARTHNLKNIDVDIPRDALVVITGPSGSGKSSLAFDTLYAEGSRRYVESLSAYARQFLQLLPKPDVDAIENLAPAIAIEQKSASHNPRSTVGTVTEIHDYLRLLYARAGQPHCPDHPQQALAASTVAQMVETALATAANAQVLVLAPLVRERKGEFTDLFAQLQAQGFVRFRVDGAVLTADELPPLARHERHAIDVVVDRLTVREAARQRLAESFETALRLAHGRALLLDTDQGIEIAFSNRYACPQCGYALAELSPRLFSFNNPAGACTACEGLGVIEYFDPQRIVVHPELSLAGGAIRGWDARNPHYFQLLSALARHAGVDIEQPWQQLPPSFQQLVLYGSDRQPIAFSYTDERGRRISRRQPFEGVLGNIERRWRETDSAAVREELARYRAVKPCPDCGGTRLKREARHVFVGSGAQRRAIYEIERMTLAQALTYFETLHLPGQRGAIAARIVSELLARLRFLNDVGLSYLTLDRAADTLSGGEAQRIRLAAQIGAGLSGVMYVLDEPSIGLHPRDNARLIATLQRLRDLGNTVIVVEHDEEAIRAADWVVDMGPGAGEHGGQVVAQGRLDAIERATASLTGDYLSGRRRIEVPRRRTPPGPHWLRLRGCRGNNLQGVDVELPLGLLICVTGVSGSGKSTLINDTLAAAVARHLYRSAQEPAPHDAIEGLEHVDKLVVVDQSPIGRTPRSNPATYTGLFTPIRELFAGTPAARERGYDAGRFSFNVRGGRCEACEGDGVIRVEMHFLPDVYVTCETCGGRRYNRETLQIQYKGLNIAQVLELTVAQAAEFFSAVPAIARKLAILMEVGLGYLRLGQAATTLSGGEAQRVKLALELSKRDTGRTLYILDEPTTGLHFHDVALLLSVLQRLRDAGNTVVVIEHNLDVIKTADWIVDLGPEGGDGGGRIVAAGTPEHVAAQQASHTGRCLRAVLSRATRQPTAAAADAFIS
ncbi:MAG: excinuclease ABC subunit UvrA [Burkholderiaceae bacterium]|nr:excinuclease ABC subunit UvrA [Burkholderiaceae bacterium]